MKKRILSLVLAIALLVTMLPTAAFAANSTSFRDVASTAWYQDAVDYVSREGIMSGVGNNKFSPETTLTRAQLCQILYNIEKKPGASNGSFSDVSASAWYSSAVNWAATQGVVNGTGNGLFSPDNPISREQMVTILYRYATYKNYNLSALVSLADYSDVNLLSNWAQDAMQWAVSEGIISGTTATTISPQGTTTRAQAATMLMRFCQRMEAKQEFYAKNISDFRGEEIINFDTSNETNFAVLVEDAITTKSSSAVNQLVSTDEEEGVYTFSHIDQTISALESGDVLYLTYGSGADDYLLLKIGTIEINGDTATVTEGTAEISDYFQYIDVDMALDLPTENFRPDNSASFHQDIVMPAYLSAIQDIPQRDVSDSTLLQIPATLAKDISVKPSTNLKFELKKDNFSVAAEVKMTIKVKITYDKTLFDIEEISYSVEQETSLNAKVSKSGTSTKHDTYKKSSKTPSVPLGTGLEAELETYFVFDVDASADGTISGKYTSESGTKYSNGVAQEINQSNADISIDIGGSFNVATGFGVAGNLKLLKIITLSLSAEAGVEADAKGSLLNASANTDEKHLCAFCIDGTLDTYFEVGFKPKVGISDKYSVTLLDAKPFKVKTEFGKFYISKLDSDSVLEFDWGKCPHKAYLVTAVATDQFGNRLTGATITIRNDYSVEAVAIGKTDADGVFKTYCENGNYRVAALSLDGYQDASEVIDVNSKAMTVLLEMEADQVAPFSVLATTNIKAHSVTWESLSPYLNIPADHPYQNVVVVDYNKVMKYTGSDVQEINVGSNNAEWIKGFTSTGYACVDDKFIINAAGQNVYVCQANEEVVYLSDNGYALIQETNGNEKTYAILNLGDMTTTLLPYDQHSIPNALNEDIILTSERYYAAQIDQWLPNGFRYDDLKGNVLLPCETVLGEGSRESTRVFSNGYAHIDVTNGRINRIIDKNGRIILSDENKDYDITGNVSAEKLIRVDLYEPDQSGFVNLNGDLVISGKFGAPRDFYNGYAVVLEIVEDYDYDPPYYYGSVGLIDPEGNFVIPFGQYKDLSDVSSAGLVWAIDRNDNLCVLKIR